MSNRHPFEIIKEHHKKADERFLREEYDDVEKISEQMEADKMSKETIEFSLRNATYWEANPEDNEIVINVSAFGSNLVTIHVPYDVEENDSSKVSAEVAPPEELDMFGDRLVKRVKEGNSE